jgi:tetratricopeptide (TPR) repeat protein
MSIMYDLLETIHHYLGGNWDLVKDHDESLVTQCETLGEIFDASQHLYWHGLIYICQGRTDVAESVVRKLDEMFKVYENDLTLSLYYGLANLLLVEYRKLHEAIDVIQNGISFAEEAGLTYFLVEFHSSLSWVYLLLGNVANSEACLEKAIEMRKEVDSPVPFQLVDFSRSQLEFDLYRLEEAGGRSDKSAFRTFRRKAAKSSKAVLKIARKVAHYRTDAYRLTGRYYWLTNKQKEALAWWERAIAEGERLNARLQLSRAFFEIGNHLLEADSRHHTLNGIRGEEYLSKAETLFKDLKLEWDLDALSGSTRGPE